MRILQIIYSLNQGGAEHFVVELSNELASLGHDVTLCVFRDDDQDSNMSFNKQFLSKSVRYINMKISIGFSIFKIKQVESFVKILDPEIVHCHLNVIPYFFKFAICNRKIKFYHTLHTTAEYACPFKYQRIINKLFYYKRWIRPITISADSDTSFSDFYNFKSFGCVYNGCVKARSSSIYQSVIKEIDSYKSDKSDKVFIHLGSCVKVKNQFMLIDAFNRLADKQYNFVLLILGKGFDTEYGKYLKSKACGNIKFLGLKSNVSDYLLCSDAFCLSSIIEGLPISLLEALSVGCVPICTPVGGVNNIIKHGVNGYLSKNFSLDEFVLVLEQYFQNDKRITPDSLIKYFEDNFSISKCANNYLKYYNL